MSNVAFFVALLLLLLLRVACCVLFSDHCAAARTATQVPLHRTAAATAIAIASPKSSSFFCAVHFAIFCLAFYTKRRWFKRFAESARRWNQLAAATPQLVQNSLLLMHFPINNIHHKRVNAENTFKSKGQRRLREAIKKCTLLNDREYQCNNMVLIVNSTLLLFVHTSIGVACETTVRSY
jgi:hypothetical protein